MSDAQKHAHVLRKLAAHEIDADEAARQLQHDPHTVGRAVSARCREQALDVEDAASLLARMGKHAQASALEDSLGELHQMQPVDIDRADARLLARIIEAGGNFDEAGSQHVRAHLSEVQGGFAGFLSVIMTAAMNANRDLVEVLNGDAELAEAVIDRALLSFSSQGSHADRLRDSRAQEREQGQGRG